MALIEVSVILHLMGRPLSNMRPVEPLAYVVVHDSPITAISAIREPPLDLAGRPRLDAEPTRIVTGSLDGSSRMVDLLDPGNVFAFGHERSTLDVRPVNATDCDL